MMKLKKMNLRIQINSKKKFIMWYTLVFSLITLFICVPFILKGNYFIGSADSNNQYYPVFVYIGRYIRDCFTKGRLKQFDFTIGLGEGIIPALNYYGFGDPLNFLAAFVSIDKSPELFSFLILVRVYLCGISMAFFCRRRKICWKYCLLSALTYAFSSFALTEGFRFYTWITAMLILPLMLAGVNDILKNRKSRLSFLFISSIFLQAVNGFYFLYMDTIFCVIYFLILCVSEKKDLLFCVKRGGKILIQYILGICLGSVILLPSVCGYLDSARSGGRLGLSLFSILLYEKEIYIDYLGNFFIGRGYSQGALAILFIELMCVIVVFSRRKSMTEWKLLSTVVLVGYMIPLFGYVMNGFAYVTDRWVYFLYFVLAAVMAEVLNTDLVERCTHKAIIICGTISFVSLIINLIANHTENTDYVRFAIYVIMLLMTLAVFIIESKSKSECIIIIVICNIVVNVCMIFWPVALGGDGFSSNFLNKEELENSFQNSIAGSLPQDMSDFNRIDIQENSYGANMALGIRGATEYLSILNRNISDFFMKLQISPGIQGSTWNLSGLDERKSILDVLSVSSYLQKGDDREKTQLGLVRNEDYLPFGFTYSHWISEDKFMSLQTPDKDLTLLNAVVLDESPGILWQEAEPDSSCVEVIVNFSYENVVWEDDNFITNKDSRIRLETGELPEGEVYIKFKELYHLSDFIYAIQVGNKSLQVLDKEELLRCFGENISDYWVKVSDLDKTGEIYIYFPPNRKYSLNKISVYVRPTDKDDIYLDELRENTFEDLQIISDDKIKGELALDENKILFISIPYSSGWKAFVNGDEREILKGNVGFCAIPLEAGRYSIELYYQTPGLKLGGLLSVFALLICFVMFWLERRRRGNLVMKHVDRTSTALH